MGSYKWSRENNRHTVSLKYSQGENMNFELREEGEMLQERNIDREVEANLEYWKEYDKSLLEGRINTTWVKRQHRGQEFSLGLEFYVELFLLFIILILLVIAFHFFSKRKALLSRKVSQHSLPPPYEVVTGQQESPPPYSESMLMEVPM